MSRAVEVTVVDLDTNESETKQISDGDFILVTTDPCWLAGSQRYAEKGTTVLTIKNHHPQRTADARSEKQP